MCGEPFQAVRFFDRPKSAPIVHRKHAGTVPLPHRCRAASATRAGVRIVMTLQPMLLNRDVLALDDCRADRAMRAGGGAPVAVSVEPKFFLSS